MLELAFQHRDWSLNRVARRVGIDSRTAARVLRDAGVDSKDRGRALKVRRARRNDMIREDVRAFAAGRGPHRSLADIARAHGVSREWVRRIAGSR